MTISERILLYLDSIIEDNAFERLCNLVLLSAGYQNINPIGGKHDRGRDAEVRYFSGETKYGVTTFFFFTRDKRSNSKFAQDIHKIAKYKHDVSQIVVVTTRKVTGATRDNWREVGKKHGCDVRVHDRDWFALQLTARQEIAVTAGIIQPSEIAEIRPLRITPTYLPVGTVGEHWTSFREEKYDAAVPALNAHLDSNATDADAWSALAWCHYQLFHYKDALRSIQRAISLTPDNDGYNGVKACILAEQGIESGAKPSLIEAKAIFSRLAKIAPSWQSLYNFANVLGALGENKESLAVYLRAIDMAPEEATLWKNAGTAYSCVGDSKEALRCYDKALAIDPNLVQALISKAILLASQGGKDAEAIKLIESAIQMDEGIGSHWPMVWYWIAMLHQKLGRVDEAIDALNQGLSLVPDNLALIGAKADLLSAAWKTHPQWRLGAVQFFQWLLEVSPDNENVRIELARLSYACGDQSELIEIVNNALPVEQGTAVDHLEWYGISLDRIEVEATRFAYIYREYRDRLFPMQTYVTRISESNFSISSTALDRIFIGYGAIFCETFQDLAKTPAKSRSVEVIATVTNKHRDRSAMVLRSLTQEIARQISDKDVEAISAKLTTLIFLVSDLGFSESNRQVGYMLGRVTVDEVVVTSYLDQVAGAAEWYSALAGSVVEWANEILRVFKD